MSELTSLRATLAAGAVSLIAGLLIGGYVAHRIDGADYAALELAVAKAQGAAKAAAEKLADADAKVAGAVAARAAADNQSAATTFNQIRKDTKNVEISIRARGLPDCAMPAGWVRQYNAAMSAGSGQAAAPAGRADAAPSRADPAQGAGDTAPSGVDQWGALDNAIDNAEGYAACRRQLNRLIDWAEGTATP